MEKENFFKLIETIGKNEIVPCKKLSMDNIVFPKWDDIGLLGMMFRQCVVTKETPVGHIYDETKFRSVLRVLDGKVIINNMLDSYTWSFDIFEKKALSCEPIGTNSSKGIINLSKIILEVKKDDEKELLADMFSKLHEDLLIVRTMEEERLCIEITKELFDKGLNYSIDEWQNPREDGSYEITKLNIGDYLIVNKETRTAYCIRGEEFKATHKLI